MRRISYYSFMHLFFIIGGVSLRVGLSAASPRSGHRYVLIKLIDSLWAFRFYPSRKDPYHFQLITSN